MPQYITRGDRPIAQPAFRILAYWPGKLSESVVSEALATIFDIFVDTHGDDVAWVAVADDDRPLRGRRVRNDLLEDTRNWIATAPKAWPSTARVFGPVSPLNAQITVPSFRVGRPRGDLEPHPRGGRQRNPARMLSRGRRQSLAPRAPRGPGWAAPEAC